MRVVGGTYRGRRFVTEYREDGSTSSGWIGGPGMDVRALEVGTLEVPRSKITGGVLGYSAEASDLGIPPGLWPVHIVVRWDAERTQRFSFCRADRDAEGDTTSVTYVAGPANLDRLVVWND